MDGAREIVGVGEGESIREVEVEERKRLLCGGEVIGIRTGGGGGGGLIHDLIISLAKLKLRLVSLFRQNYNHTHSTFLLPSKSILAPATKMTVSFGTLLPNSSSQLRTSSKLCLSEIS